ncbi:hypothetical protein F383_39100 [Gossypium arboreum]|uniref:Uncharacterized protein n=1 Tax=Gossypium arboreum TaxID=29729 RepID=A0A0B0MF67_GOSAR|nr:hypothetical protein F383_39100 [Gossypium arboreum]
MPDFDLFSNNTETTNHLRFASS